MKELPDNTVLNGLNSELYEHPPEYLPDEPSLESAVPESLHSQSPESLREHSSGYGYEAYDNDPTVPLHAIGTGDSIHESADTQSQAYPDGMIDPALDEPEIDSASEPESQLDTQPDTQILREDMGQVLAQQLRARRLKDIRSAALDSEEDFDVALEEVEETEARSRPGSYRDGVYRNEPYRAGEKPGTLRRKHIPEFWEDRPVGRGLRSLRWRINPRAVMALCLLGGLILLWAVLGSPHAEPAQTMPVPGARTSTEAGTEASGGASASASASKTASIRVHVAGAVQAPGVYSLPADARAQDALIAAGGAREEADLNRVNLAAPLSDGMQLYIPAQGEAIPATQTGAQNGSAQGGAQGPTSQKGAQSQAKGGSGSQGSSGIQNGKVNLNTATLEELQTLPKVGPALAQRIIDWRTEHGGFSSVEELDSVPGIGPATMNLLRPLVTV
ncbi:MAG: helix-hairpin-helix domain-containing protein [Rothia sp. (in: high G+C Gram-positive bacteria)]|uniref:helix-hairpin-helix domain-containing protein n=1 Tax=Rothia sp. (in: high G+C Gram-positive bacteria) TaxID=1885016 RepID=UPI0026DF3A9F|nr:helix-hairpin-helix domain-containing protein [Rothia sp. (in: high G+C Gram-positive bacteria)]MDO5750594.1 helix-hairpin-helix domain-containing protein [Rothia sp. (in: high G+C Gram-positive bacteria)]